MASESVPANMNTAVSRRSAAQQDSVWQTIKRILKPIASLRIAVVLFAMSAFLVLIGTLALDKQGMWEVVDGYFRAEVKPPQFGFVEVEATTFFPRKWFRDMYRDPVTKDETPEVAHDIARKWVGMGFMAFALIAAFFFCMSAKSPRQQIIGVSVVGGLGLYLGLFTLFKGGFYFPGGMLIGGALTINLIAAHTVRFTVKTKGLRLASGLSVIVAGIAIAVLIILNGHNQEGLRGEPPFSWEALWWVVQMGLIFACLACVAATAVLANNYFRRQRRGSKTLAFLILSASLSVLLAGSVIYFQIFAPGYDISAIRVLWQLIQGFIAALILLAGCILAFKKRAGIVLLHAGVGLLMFNELFVGMHAIEEQMLIEEGKSANFSISDQELELAIVDTEDSEEDDKVVVVPLARNGSLTRLARDGAVIDNDELPFKIKVVEFFRNSGIENLEQGDENPATMGVGVRERVELVGLPPAAGADSGSNLAGAYVKFMTKDGEKDLGTYLLTQRLSDIQRIILRDEAPESVRVDGKTYQVSLRFKRDYKPYSIYLEDVQKNDYLGTATPRDFSSFIVFKDEERDMNLNHRIWMNNPMRYAGWTYYQSGYETQSGNETTTLQMVKNRGWMIPYLACMTVVVGLAAHFVITLIRFLGRIVVPAAPKSTEKPRTHDPKSPKSPASAQPSQRPAGTSPTLNFPERNIPAWISWGIAALAVAAVIGSVGWSSIPPTPVDDEMDLYEFGKRPVVYRGRAKPMDSLARDSLRVLSKSSTFKDASDEKQPAIRWLLDHISDEELADKHQVFKITNLEVLGDLKLDRRKGFRYSFSEIGPDGVKHISEQAEKAHKMSTNGTLLTPVEEQFIDLAGKLRFYRRIREGFRFLDIDGSVDAEIGQTLQMTRYAKTLVEEQVPLAVPTSENNESVKQFWQPLAAAYHRAWLHELGKKYKAQTARELGKKLAAASAADTDGAFHKEFDTFAKNYVNELDELSQTQLRRMAAEKKELFAKLITAIYEDRISQRVSETLKETGFESALTDTPNPVALSMKRILTAYKEKDVDRFNDEVAACEEITRKFDVYENDAPKVNTEAVYNHAGWLHACFGFYILAFVLAALSWLAAPFGFFRPLNRAALAMVIATFAIHSVDLLVRIYISGRPPVTNLYSSAIFISWGFVLIGLIIEGIFRVGIGHVISSVFGTLTVAIAIFGLSSDLATGGDTMGVMQAVLDTQFWLATHVVCITLGYVTMFLAGCFGVGYIFVGLFSPLLKLKAFHDWTFGQVFSKVIYGVTCFAVFFSFYGTVLGGLWADESWGRFWGWDPKENGALIIVLWSVLILHARWAGIVKDRGLAVLAVGGNIVTAWSWFGVNQLGIGLHAYGFTEVVMRILGWFVASQLLVICLGLIPLNLWWSFRDRGDDNTVRAELV